ncbi:MAG: TadE family protein, partial [Acidimicrobiia bacterium]
LFGIVEFAWLFAQNLDVRHGAREGARLAAVDFGDLSTIGTETCNRMQIASGATVTLSKSGPSVGDAAGAAVSAPADTLTGLLDWAIPPTLVLASDVEIRLEQPPSWSDGSVTGP